MKLTRILETNTDKKKKMVIPMLVCRRGYKLKTEAFCVPDKPIIGSSNQSIFIKLTFTGMAIGQHKKIAKRRY